MWKVKQFKVGGMDNFSYLLWDDEFMVGAIVDPSLGAIDILDTAKELGVSIELILITHAHPDHTGDAVVIAETADAWISAHEDADIDKELPVLDEQGVLLGNGVIEVIHTPGHSPDSVCFLVDGNLFTGDTLFVGECGRTDIPGGDSRQLYHSLFDRLALLPDDTIVWPGHNYGKEPKSTIGKEKAESYILKERSEEEFVKFMLEP